MGWIDIVNDALPAHGNMPLLHSKAMRIRWSSDITAEERLELRVLLEAAYDDPNRWAAGRRLFEEGRPVLIFTLHDDTSAVLAMRAIGHLHESDEMWDEHAQRMGFNYAVGGASLAVNKAHQHQGLGTIIWQESTNWMKAHSGVSVLFGDTISRLAFAMYRRRNVYFYAPDIDDLCAFYEVSNLEECLGKTAHLLRFDQELLIRYAWPLQPGSEDLLRQADYVTL